MREAARITDAGARAPRWKRWKKVASDWEIAAAAQSALAGAGLGVLLSGTHSSAWGWRASAPHSPRGGTRVAGGRLGVRRALRRQGGATTRPSLRNHACAGAPSPGVRELADYSNAVCEALLETIRPGIPASDVAAAGGQGAGADSRAHRVSRPVRLPGRNRLPSELDREPRLLPLRRPTPNPLKAGMVFHLPLTLRRLGEYGAGFSETVIITEDGNESLSTIPRSLDAGA